MISVEFGEYRFFSGNNVEYRNSDPNYLLEQAATAGSIDMRRYAAAGLVRGLMEVRFEERTGQDYFDAMNWGIGVALDVLRDHPVSEPPAATQSVLDSMPPVNGTFDATSIKATETALRPGNPLLTKTAIEKHSPPEKPKIVIALGHGGIVSSLATYLELPDDTLLYPVRFSRHKAHDSEPSLSTAEMELLHTFSEDRDVIVHDEDRGGGFRGTIDHAVNFFCSEFSSDVFGITPTTGRHPTMFEPQILWYDEDGSRIIDTYGSWSPRMDELRVQAGLVTQS